MSLIRINMTFKRFHRGSMGIFSRSNPIGDDRYESHSQEAHNGNRIGEGMFFHIFRHAYGVSIYEDRTVVKKRWGAVANPRPVK